MKRLCFIVGVALFATLPSCSFIQDESLQETREIVFRGVMESPDFGPDTRAYADASYRAFWNSGDRVSIFFGKTYNREYEFIGRTGWTAGEFERVGSDPGTFTEVEIESGYNYSIYPYNRFNACDYDGTLTVTFPKEQQFSENSSGIGANLFMVARDKEGDFLFKHVAGYVGFKLYGNGVSVSRVEIQSINNEPISGYPFVVFNDEGEPFVSFNTSDPENSNKVALVCDPPVELGATANDYKTFWIAIPPTIMSKGFSFMVTDANGGTFTKSRTSSYIVERKVFKTLAALEVIPEGGDTPSVINVSSVQLNESAVSLSVGESRNLTATVNPSDATDKTVTWTSSNTAVATVDVNGKVTAVAPGTAVIVVTTTDGGKTATCTVTVTKNPNQPGDPIVIEPEGDL